ncbi:ABC transporter ATP-binding protein [Aeribacillus pallidus]|nr:ABC transporter ATP-binding protein [Aeribacillus pallidus]
MEIAVSVKNVTKKYRLYKDKWGPIKEIFSKKKYHNEFFALKNISLNFPKGETIGVLGANGSGKSTLLKIITGIAEPNSGTVEVNGSLVFLDVSSGIDPELSGYENIFMKGILLGYSKKEMMEKIDDIVEFSELKEFIYQPVKNYSSGMKSKLGFAISVNVDPDILIVDEALAVGDELFRKKCMNKMNEFKKQGKTIIFVSHDKNAVESFCSKAAWIHQGELITYGDSKFVSSIYYDFISGKKSLESIRSEVRYNHSIEEAYYSIMNEEGFLLGINGFIYDQKNINKNAQFQLIIRDTRTGEAISKPIEKKYNSQYDHEMKKNNAFSVVFSEKEFPFFFKPGKYSFNVCYKNENGKVVEFPLWAGNVDIINNENSDIRRGRFKYKLLMKNDCLELIIDNHDKVEQQINRIWFEDNLLNIEGVAFVRGFETKTADDVSITLHLINLKTFERKDYPCIISETEEITENPKFNPQGKIYNFSKFNVSLDINKLKSGKYECLLTYKMNNKPNHEFLILAWASKKNEYPSDEEPYIYDKQIIKINTETKYLQIEKNINK